MSSADEDDDMECKYDTADDGIKVASIPVLSKGKYNKKWNKLKGETPITQNVLLKYFVDMADKNKKPTTLWAYYSMLKATLRLHDKIDIKPWSKVLDFLKRKNAGYKPNKATCFTEAQLEKFLNEAPDDQWLDVKVVCIFNLHGTHSGHKLVNIKIEHIREYENYFWVVIPNAEIKQSYTITGTFFNTALRPKKIYTNRFFLHFNEGKCTEAPMGHNQFYGMPRRLAQYLNLPKPELYAGTSFRMPTASEFVARHAIHINPPKMNLSMVADASNSSSVTDQYIDHDDYEEYVDQPIELDYETGLLKTPSVRIKTPSAALGTIISNDNTTSEHVCTSKCSQVKCAKEDSNEKNVFHAFSIMKSSDYAITEVIPAQYSTDPTCRWMVAYSHFIDPVSPHNWEEKFNEITKQVPQNVKVIQKYIRCSSSKLFAAYVVVYGVNCRCQKPIFGSMAVKPKETFRKANFDPSSCNEHRRSPAVFRKPNFDPLDNAQPADLDD